MPLFNIVPDNFFKVLTSANKSIYVDSLLALFTEFKDSSYMLTKTECSVVLGQLFDKRIYELQEEEDEPIPSNKTINEYCSLILRHLMKYGWLEEQSDIENRQVYISMPPYASAILDTISQLLDPDNSKTDNCVLNIYLNLKGIKTEGINEYLFLENAYDGTIKLNRLLQDIAHNMKLYFDSLLEKVSVSAVYTEHFQEYERNITDKSYHPLKTENNAFKYRTEIQKIIRELRYDDEIQEKMVNQFKLYKKMASEDEATTKVFVYLDEIMKTFDNVDGKLKQIDKMHNQYLHTSWDRIKYLSNRNKDIQGNIIKVIELLFQEDETSQQVVDAISDSLHLNLYKSLNETSINKVRNYKPKFCPGTDLIETIDEKEEQSIKDRIKGEYGNANSEFSRENIEKFLDKNFNGKDSFNTKDIAIEDDIDFLRLIIAVNLNNKPASKYSLKLTENIVRNNGYTLPEIEFERRKPNAV